MNIKLICDECGAKRKPSEFFNENDKLVCPNCLNQKPVFRVSEE